MANKHTISRAVLTTESEENAYLKCPSCGGAVAWNKETQRRFQVGGVGFKCSACDAYVGIFSSSCCATLHIIDDNTWELIRDGKPFSCVGCSELLIHKVDVGISLTASFIEKDLLHPYTTNKNEISYISNAESRLSPAVQEFLAIYHQTTYERMRLAREQISKVENLDLSTSFVTSNNEGMFDKDADEAPFDNNELQQSIYITAISLFSAIESLAQEINVFCELGKDESKVKYTLLNNLPSEFLELKEACNKAFEHPTLEYLKGLRNLLVHRKVTLMAMDVVYELPKSMPIKPTNFRASALFYLPDEPLSDIGLETFNDKKEVRTTLRQMAQEVESVLNDVYGHLSKINSNC